MTTTNTYTDTKAVDYLQTIKKNQLEARNLKSSSSNFDMTYMLARDSEITIDTDATATAGTLADYDVVDNTGKLICYLPFDLDTLDASNSNDGTVTGTETYVDGPEISSTHPMRKAFSFNASTYITLANESNFDLDRTNTMSFSFWYNSTDSGDKAIFVKNSTTDDSGIWLTERASYTPTGSGFELALYDGSGGTKEISRTSVTRYNDGLWHHVVWTYDGTNTVAGIKFYLDGILTSTTIDENDAPIGTILHASPAIIGGENTYGVEGGTFKLKDFSVWNVELTQADVTRLSGGRQISKDTTATNPAYFGFSDVT